MYIRMMLLQKNLHIILSQSPSAEKVTSFIDEMERGGEASFLLEGYECPFLFLPMVVVLVSYFFFPSLVLKILAGLVSIWAVIRLGSNRTLEILR